MQIHLRIHKRASARVPHTLIPLVLSLSLSRLSSAKQSHFLIALMHRTCALFTLSPTSLSLFLSPLRANISLHSRARLSGPDTYKCAHIPAFMRTARFFGGIFRAELSRASLRVCLSCPFVVLCWPLFLSTLRARAAFVRDSVRSRATEAR